MAQLDLVYQQRMTSQGKIAKQGANRDFKIWDGLKRDEGKLRILHHVLRGGNLDDHQWKAMKTFLLNDQNE